MEDHALGNPFFCWMKGNGAAAWKTPARLGSAEAIYIEDCHIEFHNPKSNDSPALPTMDGARAVFRHNMVHDGFLEFFGVDSTPRGTVSFEVYDNSFTGKCFCTLGLKGGTGVVFNNTIRGDFQKQPLWATEYRTGGPRQKYGQCDGTSRFDGNLPLNDDKQAYTGSHSGNDGAASLTCAGKHWKPGGLAGYAVWNVSDHCVGKILANTEDTIGVVLQGGKRNNWNAGDAFKVTNGYPAIDQIGRGRDAGPNSVHPQILEPVYAWNNKYNGELCSLKVRRFYPREEEYVREGRDFFNARKPGYTPLAYPHPVVAADQTMSHTGAALNAAELSRLHDQAQEGVWTDVTPAALNLSPTYDPSGNYGVNDVLADPARPGDFYAFVNYQGVWKSSDFGVTWTKIMRQGRPYGSRPRMGRSDRQESETRSVDAAADVRLPGLWPPRGAWVSANGGVDWTRYSNGGKNDHVYNFDTDPSDCMHVISANHDDDHCYESSDGGAKWVDKGQIVAAGVTGTHSSYVWFISADMWLAVSEAGNGKHGTFRTTDRGATWTNVLPAEHAHGANQVLVDQGRDLSAPHRRHPQVNRPRSDVDPGLAAAGIHGSGYAQLPLRQLRVSFVIAQVRSEPAAGAAGHGHALVHRLHAAASHDQRHETGGRILRWEALCDRERQLVRGRHMALCRAEGTTMKSR